MKERWGVEGISEGERGSGGYKIMREGDGGISEGEKGSGGYK